MNMQVNIHAADLKAALPVLARGTSKKGYSLPILSCVRIAADSNGYIGLTTTDLETRTHLSIHSDDHINPGSVAVDLKALQAIVKAAKKDDIVRITEQGDKVTATVGSLTSVLPSLPIEEWPNEPQDGTDLLVLPVDTLRSMVKETEHCLSKDDYRPILTGFHVVQAGTKLTIEAADNYRLSRATSYGMAEIPPFDFVLSGAGLRQWARSASKHDGEATIRDCGQSVSIESGNLTVHVRKVDGRYPNVDRVMPVAWEHEITFDRAELENACRSIAGHIDGAGKARRSYDSNRAVNASRFTFEDSTLRISTVDGATSLSVMPVEGCPEELTIGVDPIYMAQALATSDEPYVRIGINAPLHPIVILGDLATQVVMPVNLKNVKAA